MVPNASRVHIKNRFIVLPADHWLYSERVGKYQLIEFENVTLEKGAINLLHYAE
jgi:hypothetical protein